MTNFVKLRFGIFILFSLILMVSSKTEGEQKANKTKKDRIVIRTPGDFVDPNAKPLYPETKELLDKLKEFKTNKDVEEFQEADDTFELVDFGKPNGPTDENIGSSKSSAKSASSCKATPKNTVETQKASQETSTSTRPKSTDQSANAEEQLESSEGMSDAVKEMPTSDPLPDVMESDNNDSVTKLSDQAPSDPDSVPRKSFISAVEEEVLNPTPPELPPSSDSSKKKKKKKKRIQDPPPTKQQLEETYKYEVLPPPDNSPVTLDFPATPAAQGEEHLSQHVPLPLYCDSCMAIAFQLHLTFKKFNDQVRKRAPTESEIYHMVSETCQRSRFNEYGMLEVHGQRHITGPGCNKLESEGGVKHSRGPWPRRLSDRCEEMTEDIGEIAIHSAWLRERISPERLKQFLCFGAPPRNYCQRYGHTDGAAAAAEYRRKKQQQQQQQEDPVDAARRLALEAEQEADAKDEL